MDLSYFEHKDEVWSNLSDDDLPNLRFLKLHGNKINIRNLQYLNLKRPKLLISTERNYFINWAKTGNDVIFHDIFDSDIKALMNDLHKIDGFCGFEIHLKPSMNNIGPK